MHSCTSAGRLPTGPFLATEVQGSRGTARPSREVSPSLSLLCCVLLLRGRWLGALVPSLPSSLREPPQLPSAHLDRPDAPSGSGVP